ncbi:Ribose-5-phosphate isomerase isoform 2 [Schistosoma japonicum]|uniref:ribose-5-phosphate isomerase n=2 Tax=Schistosoma japonicum TaxID=6182 RepID=A0A4Z2DAY4_SCHJA|nr:Ribose-5-phosphate isomerase isoform 2 [Schistosoma japonicum]
MSVIIRRYHWIVAFRNPYSLCSSLFSKPSRPFIYVDSKLSMAESNALECAKQKACQSAVSDWLKNNQIIGLGSGTTIKYAVEFIAEKVESENLQIQCIPTSFQARQLLINHKLPVTDLDIHEKIDVTFDGADEVDEDLHLIKGGGGCLLQEKIVASCTANFIAIVDERKHSKRLGSYWTKGLPIEVIPMAFKPIQTRIEKLFGGKVILREAVSKMGPVVTDNGNFLLDWKFDTNKQYYWPEVNIELSNIPGITSVSQCVIQ